MMSAMHDDPVARAFADSFDIEVGELEDDQGQPFHDPSIIGALNAWRCDGTETPDGVPGWHVWARRVPGLVPGLAEAFDGWARGRIYRLILTGDPTVDGWKAHPHGGWMAVAGYDETPDMSFLG
jgi:hypothetical protein